MKISYMNYEQSSPPGIESASYINCKGQCSATGKEPEGRQTHEHMHSALPSSSSACCLAFILPHLWYLGNNMTSAWRRAVALHFTKSRMAESKFQVTERCAKEVRQSFVVAKLFKY